MAEVQWYYARNDQQYGPVSASELKQLADDGRLTPDDLLWREGMDAWTTAINLRGLFEPAAALKSAGAPAVPGSLAGTPPARRPPGSVQAPPRDSLRSLLRGVQTLLWTLCVLVVLCGLVLFTREFMTADTPDKEAAAAAVFGVFFIAAYVLARAGEKLSRLLRTVARRRSR